MQSFRNSRTNNPTFRKWPCARRTPGHCPPSASLASLAGEPGGPDPRRPGTPGNSLSELSQAPLACGTRVPIGPVAALPVPVTAFFMLNWTRGWSACADQDGRGPTITANISSSCSGTATIASRRAGRRTLCPYGELQTARGSNR